MRKIARLEAEAADPWREAKKLIVIWEQSEGYNAKKVACEYVRHLEAENAAKDAAIARLATDHEKIEQHAVLLLEELKDRAKERDDALARVAELESREVPPLDFASLDRRLAAIEQRLDAEDMYRQEQNERSE